MSKTSITTPKNGLRGLAVERRSLEQADSAVTGARGAGSTPWASS